VFVTPNQRKLVVKLTFGSGTKVTCANTSSVSGSAYKKKINKLKIKLNYFIL